MPMARVFILFMFPIFMSLIVNAAKGADEFPFRAKYPNLKTVSTENLAKIYDKVLIVDARSKFEFDVVRIKDAKLVPMSNMSFVHELEKLRPKKSEQAIVFYCNGKTCEKSYEAGDAAVIDWVTAFPDKGALFGKSPVDKSKILDSKAFKQKSLDFASFKSGAEKSDSVAIDIRDPVQRKVTPDIKGLRNIQLDKLIPLLEGNQLKGSELYFLDAVGKQNVWLQYYLEGHGFKNYHFLDGGVDGQKNLASK
jgi:rhodanese-related sulfurtransferase